MDLIRERFYRYTYQFVQPVARGGSTIVSEAITCRPGVVHCLSKFKLKTLRRSACSVAVGLAHPLDEIYE